MGRSGRRRHPLNVIVLRPWCITVLAGLAALALAGCGSALRSSAPFAKADSLELRITNTGTATMWNVDAVLPPEAVNWQFLADALPSWPVEEMAPDDAVTIPVVVTLGQTVAVTLRIRGHSELGPYERNATVSVHD